MASGPNRERCVSGANSSNRLQNDRCNAPRQIDGCSEARELKRRGHGSGDILNVPKDAGKTYTKGVRALNDGKWEAAQHEFEKAAQLYPDYAQAWKDLGESFLRQGKKAEAEDAFQHALKADPKYVPPYLALARLDLDAGKTRMPRH